MTWIPNEFFSYTCRTSGRAPLALRDLMPDPATDAGVFAYMSNLEFISPLENNLEYLYNVSGDKLPSSLVAALAVDNKLSESSLSSLATVILSRFGHKWDKMWDELSSSESMLQTVNLKDATTYDRTNVRTGKEVLAKDGSEVFKKTGTETTTESYPQNRVTERTISGGWEDTDDTVNTRTGTETTSETYPTARTSSKSVTGSYADTDTTTSTRTGSSKVTERGDTLSTGFGFNSSTGTPVAKSGPADTQAGISSETTYGEGGLKDAKSGAITRTYNNYQEQTTETGERQLATDYGADGLKDSIDGSRKRQYQNYSDTVTESGKRQVDKDYDNIKEETSFTDRADTKEYQDVTDKETRTNETTRTGYEIRRLSDKTEMLKALYTDPTFYDFMRVVYSDIDEVLTMQIWV